MPVSSRFLYVGWILLCLGLCRMPAFAEDAPKALPPDYVKAKAALDAKIAKDLFDTARNGKIAGFEATAKALAEEALALDPASKEIPKFLAGIDAAAADKDNAAKREDFDKKVAKVRKKGVDGYLPLAAQCLQKELYDEAVALLRRSVVWQREHPGLPKALETACLALADKDQLAGAELLAAELRAIDPENKTLAKTLGQLKRKAAIKDHAVVYAPEHWLAAMISLPGGWKAGEKYPVIVAVEGAGCNFEGMLKGYANGGGKNGWIVVTPITFSSTNPQTRTQEKYQAWYDAAKFQEIQSSGAIGDPKAEADGLCRLLDWLTSEWNADAGKVFITGFSGGGNLCYTMLLQHSERLAGSAPACANCYPQLYGELPAGAGEIATPVMCMIGKSDQYNEGLIRPQTELAMKLLQDRGYTRVQSREFDGGHSAFAEHALPFFQKIRDGKDPFGE